jgi:hypothetical protein
LQMTQAKYLFATLVLAATVAFVPAANAAAVVHFVGAGSSAQFQATGYAVYNDIALPKAGGTAGVTLVDPRNAAIVPEPGTVWVVWVQTAAGVITDVWTDASVDSIVGNRAFFAAYGGDCDVVGGDDACKNGVELTLDPATAAGTTAGDQLISATLWGNDVVLPAAVYTALTPGGVGANVNAGLTDIRPEDAAFGSARVLGYPVNTTRSKLGYGNPAAPCSAPVALKVGCAIQSSYSGAVAHPVAFSIHGNDPLAVPVVQVRKYTTLAVGAAPIIIIENRTNAAGLGTPGKYLNVVSHTPLPDEDSPIGSLWDGVGDNGAFCDGKTTALTPSANVAFPITVAKREPLSGTYNTFEFTLIRTEDFATISQETGVDPQVAGDNPLNIACGVGRRRGTVGTGDMVKNAVFPNADTIGYTFFSFGNVSKIAASPNYAYLTLDGVDPDLLNGGPVANQELPTCTVPCSVAPGASFTSLRNGTYTSWSLLRIVADPTDAHFADVQQVVQAEQNDINHISPDFVPFQACPTLAAPCNGTATDAMDVYRSHFTQSTIVGNNGAVVTGPFGQTLGGGAEAGGDMGGEIIGPNAGAPPNILNCKQFNDDGGACPVKE